MSRITSLGEVTVLAPDDVEDIDSPNRSVSVKIRNGNRGFPHYAPRGGIITTGASYVGRTEDNTGLAFGTGNITFYGWVRRPSYGTLKYLVTKFASNLGIKIQWTSGDLIRVQLGNGSNFTTYQYDSTAAVGAAAEAWVFWAVTLTRAGNMVVYINGAQLGNTVDISGSSAQTLTNTGALIWGSDGTTHIVGTFGRCGIISGIPTATNIADINRAGNVEPFAASFTFLARPDFAQGYGVIIKDQASLGQPALIGSSGLSHAVPINPPGVPARAPRVGLSSDSSGTSWLRSTLNSQDPGSNDLVLWWDGIFPSDTDTNGRCLASVSSGTSDVLQAQSFSILYSSTGGLSVRLHGATTSDYISLASSTTLPTLLAGKRVVICALRGSIYFGVDGDFINVTNLFATSTAGTPPAWTGTITGTYLYSNCRGQGSTTSNPNTQVFDVRLANVAMTEAQLRAEYQLGEPLAALMKVATQYTSDFSAGADSWTTNEGTVTGNVDSINGQNDTLRFFASANAGNHFAQHAISTLRAGDIVRITGLIYVPTGQTNLTSANLRFGNDTESSTTWTLLAGAKTYSANAAWQTFDATVLINATYVTGNNNLRIFTNFGTAGAGVNTDDLFYIKNLVVTWRGYTARLRTDSAGALTALNAAKSSSVDSTDFLFGTSGVTPVPDGRTQIIRFSTNTNGNQQLFGASVIDTTKKWRIRVWNFNCASGTPTVSLGNASAGTQYVNAMTAATGINDVTLATRYPTTANLWCNSNSTAQLDHVVILEQVE